MRPNSLLSSLAVGLVAACLVLAQPPTPGEDFVHLALRACGVAWLSCLAVLLLLVARPPEVVPVPEAEYAALVPPPTPRATQGDLYLDLLKRVLLNVVYHEQSYQVVLSHGDRRRNPELAGPKFSLADRVAGEEYVRRCHPVHVILCITDPLCAPALLFGSVSLNTLSMIGLRRLDNLQACVEAVLAEDVPGDLVETGVAKGGACILMRAVLRVRKERTRRVICCDSFASGQEGRGPPPAAALLLRPLFSLLALASRLPFVAWHRRLYALLMRMQHSFPVDAASVSADTLASFLFFLRSGARFVRPPVPTIGTSVTAVRSHFARLGLLDDQVVFLKGFFAETLPDAPPEQIAILRLDGDLYASTRDALLHLYPRLSSRGFCIVDDYYSFEECRRAVDEYRQAHSIREPLQRIDAGSVFWRVS